MTEPGTGGQFHLSAIIVWAALTYASAGWLIYRISMFFLEW